MTEHITLHDSRSVFPVIDPRKTIFWVGAGIGCLTPCDLPLGNGLTDAYLEAMLGADCADRFSALWNNHIPNLRDAVQGGQWHETVSTGAYTAEDVRRGAAKERPRLEFIIGEMNKLDEEFGNIHFQKKGNQTAYGRQPSIHALKYFADAQPNLYHYWLADFIRSGSMVVTANFDTCIEKALGADKARLDAPVLLDGVKAVDCGGGQCVYHFHGVAADSSIEKNLGATINNVSKSLPSVFQEKLKRCFQAGYDIVFLGYSGSDFFDVQPFFHELRGAHYPGRAIYLHYCPTDDACAREKNRAKRYQYLLAPFQQQVICYGTTEIFFEVLSSGSGVHCTKDAADISNIPGSAFAQMKHSLDAITSSADPHREEVFRFLNMLRLSSQLNINPKWFYPDWVDRLEAIYSDWKNDAPNQATLEKMAHPKGQMNDCIIDDIFYNNWHSRKRRYRRIIKELKPLVAKWNCSHRTELSPYLGWGHAAPKQLIESYVAQTCRILECGAVDPIEEHTERSTIHYLCGKQTKKLFLRWAILILSRRKTEAQLQTLLKYVDRLLTYPFSRFLYRTYYLSLCRQRNILCAILNTGDKSSLTGCYGDLQQEWNICMETPNLFDAGQTITNRVLQMIFMALRGEKIDLSKMKQLWEIRRKIVFIRKD